MTRSPIDSTTLLRRNDGTVSVDMDGETVMMDIDRGSYFALAGSGSFIWATLEQPATLAQVTAHVREEFDADGVDDVDAMVADFVADLLANGLLIPAD